MTDKKITYRNGRVFLDTSMNENFFAKTRMSEKISEEGIRAEFRDGNWSFSPWRFSGTCTSEEAGSDRITDVFLEGEFGASFVFLEALETSEDRKQFLLSLCSCIESAAKENQPLPNIGAGGILLGEDWRSFLFLPENLFHSALQISGDGIYSTQSGVFITPFDSHEHPSRFLEAVMIYRGITGRFPYPNLNSEERRKDILDRNYILLENSVPRVESEILEFADGILSGKKNLTLDLEALDRQFSKEPVPENEIEAYMTERQKSIELKEKKVASKRWFMKNRIALAVSAIAITALSSFAVSYRNSLLAKPTSMGLTSRETVEMFYSAVNNLDTDAALNCTSKKLRGRVNILSNIYVTGKARSIYENQYRIVTPAQWFGEYKRQLNIYGLTNFTVDGSQGRLHFKGPKKNTKPEPLEIPEGQNAIHTVRFYLINITGEDDMEITEQTEEVLLVFTKGRWIIDAQDISERTEVISKKEYCRYFEECGSIEEMRREFFFIPTDEEIREDTLVERLF